MDVFISYSMKDRDFAERLADDLKRHGLSVWWDQWQLDVGDSLTERIERGISTSAWLAVVLSPNSVDSPWVRRELSAALAEEIDHKRLIVLPLLYRDCAIPLFLKDKVYADFRQSYQRGLQVLVARLRPPLDPSIVEGLMSLDESSVLKAHARIPRQDHQKYREVLHRRLSGSETEDRLGALFALGTLHDPTLRVTLPTLVSDRSNSVRQQVAFYLGRLRHQESVPTIERLMQDADPMVRATARAAYRILRGKPP